MGRIRSAAIMALLVAAAAPATADALTVGTNLNNHAANVNFDCRWRPSTIGPIFSGGPSNCTYLGTAPDQSTGAPVGGGVVTRVRVKAGARTGPMQVTVVEALASTTTGFTCCFYGGESQRFTPRANRTTSVGVRLPVASYTDPDAGIQVVDYLGLTVLANNVDIPGQYPGNNGLEGSLGFFPRISRADNIAGRVDGYGNSLIPLLNADITPLCGGGNRTAAARAARSWPRDAALPPPAVARAGRCLGGVSIRNGTIGGSSASVPLDCNLTVRCRGKLTLLSKNGGTTLGKSKFKLGPGARKKVSVKLTKAGRKAAKGKGSLGAKAKAKVKGAANETTKLKLKR